MPKLTNKPPKYAKLKQYAVVYMNGKTHYLGIYGSEESKVAYARLIAENRVSPIYSPPENERGVGRKKNLTCMTHKVNEINNLWFAPLTNNTVIIVYFHQNTIPLCQILQPFMIKRLIAILES